MIDAIHVTHEAVHKIGGIGSVLEGLITSEAYADAVRRTILLCPLFSIHGDADSRLGPEGEVQYSSLDGRTRHPLGESFRHIQQQFGVELVYGHRMMRDPVSGRVERPEVILVDVTRINSHEMNTFKFRLFERFGIDSTRYEHSWDYEQYVRLAQPGLAAVRAVGIGLGVGHPPAVVLAHEFMGVPTALAAKLHPHWGMKTAFYAHEVAPIRKIVEEHPGHDTMFYNVLRKSEEEGRYIRDVFGDPFGYFRHALVDAARHLDATLAVGDHVIRELHFLSKEMAKSKIHLVYNGVPAHDSAIQEAEVSKKRLQEYANRVLGIRPDYVFTHVTRLVTSKGLWRDLRVMHYIDAELHRRGQTGLLIVLSTEIGGPRSRHDIRHMEQSWDWPVAHREGMPDLTGGEANYYAGVQAFNTRSRACKVLFINQFGFSREACGDRMPAEMEFWDIRRGSDVEFGQSIYEPFGIAQIEAISYGAICVMSNVCGCAPFVVKAASGEDSPNIIIADYTAYRKDPDTIENYQLLTREERETFEDQVARGIAAEVLRRLPRTHDEKAAFIRRGYELADRMSWEVVARDYLLPVLNGMVTAGAACEIA